MAQSVPTPFSSLRREWRWRLPIEGRYWLLLTTVILAFGLLKTINLLALLGCFLLAVAILNALAAGRGLNRLQARRRLVGPFIARQFAPLEVELRNVGTGTRVGLKLEDGGSERSSIWFVPQLPGGAMQVLPVSVALPRRGVHRLGPLVVESGYPFGLIGRRRILLGEEEVVVWPRTGQLDQTLFRRFLRGAIPLPDRSRGRPRPQPQAQTEFFGLRLYRAGDNPRSIHWRSSARRGELLVRECEEPAGEDLTVVVDPFVGHAAAESFEETLSLAATICRLWCRRVENRLALVVAAPTPIIVDGPSSHIHERRVLDRLAMVQPGANSDPHTLRRSLTTSRLPQAAVVLIAVDGSALIEVVRRALKQSVFSLDASRAAALGFYQLPAEAVLAAASTAAVVP
jgi:uncharacterized protein (DUF58 family)